MHLNGNRNEENHQKQNALRALDGAGKLMQRKDGNAGVTLKGNLAGYRRGYELQQYC